MLVGALPLTAWAEAMRWLAAPRGADAGSERAAVRALRQTHSVLMRMVAKHCKGGAGRYNLWLGATLRYRYSMDQDMIYKAATEVAQRLWAANTRRLGGPCSSRSTTETPRRRLGRVCDLWRPAAVAGCRPHGGAARAHDLGFHAV